ncbi:uncharacterized protein LOC119725732 [Patiria miniata]|uniref:Uncharacterized protein n=1 Tax=Patiria miniata TaxID=46514 RepID=A0A913ZPZ9_PATMI|nr:uncharacterized protein LOC119725732 [Patiria miniata]
MYYQPSTNLLLLSLAVLVGVQGVNSGEATEWVAKDDKGQVCMKIKFDGLILYHANSNYNTYFQDAVLIDPKPNCKQSVRTITIGFVTTIAPQQLQLTFQKQSQGFVFTSITAKWYYYGIGSGGETEIVEETGSRSSDNFLPKSIPLGCYYFQDQSLSIPVGDNSYSAEMKNVTFQPFADCAKNDYGNDFSSGDCQADCSGSGAARPGNDVIYILLAAVVGALSVKFGN